MKNYLIIIVAALLLVGCSNKVEEVEGKAVEENEINYEVSEGKLSLSYKINSVEKDKQDDGTYKITSNGMNNTYDNVQLPYISYVLALPIDTDIDSVEVVKKGDMNSFTNIKIAELGLSTIGGNKTETIEEIGCNSKVLVQSFKGIKVAYITLYPFDYNENKQELSWLNEAEIVVTLKEDQWDLSHLETFNDIKGTIDNLEMIDEYKKLLNIE